MKPELSIIIPTYKEAGRIGQTLDQLAKYIKESGKNIEVLIVDAQSPDGTVAEAKVRAKQFQLFRIIVDERRLGKGKQVRDGMFEAQGRYIMFMDADLATPLKYLDQVFENIKNHKPIAICVRNLEESHKGIRKFISTFGNFLVQLLLLPGIKDSQCGFKAFEAQAAKEIFSRQTVLGWGFDMEILTIARKLGYDISLIDVPDWHDVVKGSKISGQAASKVALQTFRDLINIKWNVLVGRYKKPNFTYVPHEETKPNS